MLFVFSLCVFFFKHKTAYEMRISDWSSDVCSSDLVRSDCLDGNRMFELTDCVEHAENRFTRHFGSINGRAWNNQNDLPVEKFPQQLQAPVCCRLDRKSVV